MPQDDDGFSRAKMAVFQNFMAALFENLLRMALFWILAYLRYFGSRLLCQRLRDLNLTDLLDVQIGRREEATSTLELN